MLIYIDSDFKVYTTPGEGLREIETDYFVGKCAEYIEGYRLVPEGQAWVREDGVKFVGEMLAPWRNWDELDAAQREYERQQLADMQAALDVIYAGVTE